MILVVGATGSLGSTVTRMLLEQGRNVRVLVRSNNQAFPGAEVVLGDLKQRASLDAACRGVDTVITTANSAMRGGADNVQTVDLDGNRHLIDAAKKAGVKQFIFVSALAADPNSPLPFFQAKASVEDYLRSSGLPYTIVAPNLFIEIGLLIFIGGPALSGQPVIIVGEGRRKHSFVSIHDVATFILAAVGNSAALNHKLFLGGPEPLSLRDIVAIYERVLGHPIPITRLAPGQSAPGAPEIGLQILANLDTYESPMDMTETARTFGVRLTPFEEIARKTHRATASA